MQTCELQDLLRDGAAMLPPPSLDGRLQVARRVRKHRLRRRSGLAAAAVVAVAAAALGVSALPHTHRQMVSVSPPASSAIPVVPAGTRQILQPAPPIDLRPFGATSGRSSSVDVVAGTAHTFTVQGTPTFEVADVTPGTGPMGASHGWTIASALFYLGVGGASGTGYNSAMMPLDSAGDPTHSPVAIIADWPAPGQQLYVWSHLPPGTAYVTYSYQGADLNWQTPVDGTIAFLLPRPVAFEGDYATWHGAPLPVMRAYDDAGHLLVDTKAPRIGGDDLKVGS